LVSANNRDLKVDITSLGKRIHKYDVKAMIGASLSEPHTNGLNGS